MDQVQYRFPDRARDNHDRATCSAKISLLWIDVMSGKRSTWIAGLPDQRIVWTLRKRWLLGTVARNMRDQTATT